MKSTILLSALALTTSALSQDLSSLFEEAPQTGIYVEPKSNIFFSTFQDATNGFTFGIALPETPSTHFIGLLVGRGTGWSGVSLGGSMLNKLLLVAWPNGSKGIVGTFRKTAKYGSPPETTSSFTLTPIEVGTYINATHWSYIFVCANCIATDGTTFSKTDATGTLGWGFSAAAPATPASSSSSLGKHSAQGIFSLDLAAAKSAQYATWAALATKSSAVAGRVMF